MKKEMDSLQRRVNHAVSFTHDFWRTKEEVQKVRRKIDIASLNGRSR